MPTILNYQSTQSAFWVGRAAEPLHQISKASYTGWIADVLCWADGSALLLPQFGLLESCTAAQMIECLPALLQQCGDEEGAPLLKRRRRGALGQRTGTQPRA